MSWSNEASILEYPDRSFIDIMKENMLSEKVRNDDYIKVLKDLIQAYITELSHKNEQIKSLIKLLSNNTNKAKLDIETMPEVIRGTLLSIRNVECVKENSLVKGRQSPKFALFQFAKQNLLQEYDRKKPRIKKY